MPVFKIAMVALRQGDNYLLQRRPTKSGAGGLIGFFGGKIEPDEEPAAAACRELAEETSVSLSTVDLGYVGEVSIVMDHPAGKNTEVHAKVFEASTTQKVVAHEGDLVVLSLSGVKDNMDMLTPATHAAFNELIIGRK